MPRVLIICVAQKGYELDDADGDLEHLARKIKVIQYLWKENMNGMIPFMNRP